MENNKNKKSVKFQGYMLNFYDFIQVFVFTTNHHLNVPAMFLFPTHQEVVLGNFQCRDALLIWIIEGRGPTVLAVGAGGAVMIFFSSLSFLFSFFSLSLSLSPGDDPIQTEILSQRVARPKASKPNPRTKRCY